MQKPYFKYSLLNGFRDDLFLTVTRQKVTLIHLLQAMLATSGLSFGFCVGKGTHSWAIGTVAGIVGSGVGLLAAWLLPRLLWSILCLFVRRGWFLVPELPPSDDRPALPVITIAEFNARSDALNRGDFRRMFIALSIIFGGVLGGDYLIDYIESIKAPDWIHELAIISMLSVLIGLVPWGNRMRKRRIRNHGMECPSCGREITDSAGLNRLPEMGLCRHCGTQVVAIPDQKS
jgi:hypothetical protein